MIQIQLLSRGLNKKFSCHPAFDLAPRNTLSPIDLPVLQLAVFCSLAELQTQTHHLSWVEAIASWSGEMEREDNVLIPYSINAAKFKSVPIGITHRNCGVLRNVLPP